MMNFFVYSLVIYSAVANNLQWNYDDPRWDSEIPNWWDEPNFNPPKGPIEENDKNFWINKAQSHLSQKLNQKLNTNVAKNIVIMIGDGMGLPSQMATRSYMGDVSNQLSFEKFPYAGLSNVYCVNYQVPDSACTATAMLTGIKNNFMVLGHTADVNLRNCSAGQDRNTQVDSIFKYAQDSGKSTGFVTTTRVTHATIAAAYAHSASRQYEGNVGVPSGCTDIANQLVHGITGQNLDVIFGGGSRYFLPESEGGRRTDERDLIGEYRIVQRMKRNRAVVVRNRNQLLSINTNTTDKVLGLFSSSHMDYYLRANQQSQPTLTEMTAKAIEILKKNENGFVLLVEGGRIDTSHHENRAKIALEEVVQFHKAVQYVKDNTDESETLIVVTADHSHPFTVGGYLPRDRNVLGVGDFSIEDNMWIFSASYAQGQGNIDHVNPTGGRRNPRGMHYMDPNFRQPAGVPMDEGTHSGEDVGVFANGPWSHLFTGVFEQNFIAHAMMYAGCIGPKEFLKNPQCPVI